MTEEGSVVWSRDHVEQPVERPDFGHASLPPPTDGGTTAADVHGENALGTTAAVPISDIERRPAPPTVADGGVREATPLPETPVTATQPPTPWETSPQPTTPRQTTTALSDTTNTTTLRTALSYTTQNQLNGETPTSDP